MSVTPSMRPVYLGVGDGAAFAWHHPASLGGRTGVVVCAPFGYEAVCCHQSLLEAAAAVAATGAAVLRVEYLGTGDSSDGEGGGIEQWVASVAAAERYLLDECAVEQVVLVGVRLGAAAAILHAGRSASVRAVACISPVASGRSYLRELKALQSAFGATVGGLADEELEGEALGFPLVPRMRDSVRELDLEAATELAGKHVALFDRPGLSVGKRFVDNVMRQSASLMVRPATGYQEMMLDPHLAVVPTQLIGELAAWVAGLASAPRDVPTDPIGPRTDADATPTAAARLSLPDGVEETCVRVSAVNPKWGILTTPGEGRPGSATAFILLNAGAVYRIGPDRLYVRLARRWAAAGHTVLRLDNCGIGDSPPRPGEPLNVVYASGAVQDAIDAVEELRRLAPGRAIHLVGVCSGAYHALQAAERSALVEGIVPINPLTFFWDYGRGEPVGELHTSQAASRHAAAGLSMRTLGSIVSNPVRLLRVASFVFRRARQLAASRVQAVARALRLPVDHDLAALLGGLLRRRVRVQFIFAAADPGLDLMRVHAGNYVDQRVRDGSIGLATIAGADHTFTLRRHQDELVALLDRYVDVLGDRPNDCVP